MSTVLTVAWLIGVPMFTAAAVLFALDAAAKRWSL